MQRANSFHYENKVNLTQFFLIITLIMIIYEYLVHLEIHHYSQRLGVSPAMARVDESEDEVFTLMMMLMMSIMMIMMMMKAITTFITIFQGSHNKIHD